MEITQDLLTSIAGALLSLAFSYFPGLSEAYETLDPTRKRLVMLIFLVIAALGLYAASCAGLFGIPASVCTETGTKNLAWIFILCAVVNQTAYGLTKKEKQQ